jgi:hypothetical protein
MKTIKIRKSTQFSEDSRIMVHAGGESIFLRGYDSRPLTVDEDQELYASHQWTESNRLSCSMLKDGHTYFIKPRLSKGLAFIIFLTLMACGVFFYFTMNRWSFVPLLPFALYVLAYITVLRKKYLILELYD